MKLKDFTLLKKFMSLATSDNDHEALQALRRANAILLQYQRTWVQVLDRVVSVEGAFEEDPEATTSAGSENQRSSTKSSDADDVNFMFQTVLDDLKPGDFRSFILSLQAQYQEKRWLSPPQREALVKSFNRVRDRR